MMKHVIVHTGNNIGQMAKDRNSYPIPLSEKDAEYWTGRMTSLGIEAKIIEATRPFPGHVFTDDSTTYDVVALDEDGDIVARARDTGGEFVISELNTDQFNMVGELIDGVPTWFVFGPK